MRWQVLKMLERFKVPPHIQKERMDICLKCEHLFHPTKTCKKCGCFMGLKTWARDLKCPIDKWSTHGSGASWDVDQDLKNDNPWGQYDSD